MDPAVFLAKVGDKKMETFKKRTVLIDKKRIALRKDGVDKNVIRNQQVHNVQVCKSHGKQCVVFTGGDTTVHLKGDDHQELFVVLCEIVAENKSKINASLNSGTSTSSLIEDTGDLRISDGMMSAFGGSGMSAPTIPSHDSSSNMASEHFDTKGFKCDYPIVLVPGLASSALDVVESLDSSFKGKRVWISLGGLAAGKMGAGDKSSEKGKGKGRSPRQLSPRKNRDKAKVKEEKKEMSEDDVLAIMLGGASGQKSMTISETKSGDEIRSGNKWLKHMCLNENRDGFSDPIGIKTRPVRGVAGCAYLSKDKLSSPLSYVFGYLVDVLKRVGYVEDENMIAATYDWRCALSKLEEKYCYFSNLRRRIVELVEKNEGKRVMMVAHSMGNRITQYFLQYILHTDGEEKGKEWINSHIEAFLACGAPWLGAPKILRALNTGDRMDLDMFLTKEEGHELVRSCGSLPALLPCSPPGSVPWRLPWAADRSKAFCVLKHGDQFVESEELFVRGNVLSTTDHLRKLYDPDPVWAHINDKPPVHIYNVIGVNLPTETAYSFIEQSEGFVLDDDKKCTGYISEPGFVWDEGIFYESEKFVPNRACSGDGTVPLTSLMHATTAWGATHVEIPGAEHREMLKDPKFINAILRLVCGKEKGGAEGGVGGVSKLSQWGNK